VKRSAPQERNAAAVRAQIERAVPNDARERALPLSR